MKLRLHMMRLATAIVLAIVMTRCGRLEFDVLSVEIQDDDAGPDTELDTAPDVACEDSEMPIDYYPDCDGDGEFSDKLPTLACDEDDADRRFNCQNGEPPGSWSAIPGTDCDDEDDSLSAAGFFFPDCDGDEVFDLKATKACGTQGADMGFDCRDGDSPDGGWDKIPGTDCDDEDKSVQTPQFWYPDCDGDGSYAATPSPTWACGKSGADEEFDCFDGSDPDGGWSSQPGADCEDDIGQSNC